LRIFPKKITHREKNIVWRKSYTAMFKLEVADFTKEKGNRKAARKFNVGDTSVREWREEEVTVTCVKNGFQKALGDTSMPEIEDDEESTSENELNDVPEEIINALHSFD
jgi:Zn ribbon nucleic-acid-binding protein